LGNNPVRAFPSIIRFHDTLTWLSQIVMFIVLGLLVTPSKLLEVAPTAIIFAFFLMFIARPVAVWLCLIPYPFNAKEKIFISWVGLRGAVSIFLAAIPVLSGLPHAELYFNVAFFVVIISLILQGWTITPAARKLKVGLSGVTSSVHRVEVDLPGQDTYELAGYHIEPDSNILDHGIIPSWARINMIIRAGQILKPEQAGDLQVDDYVYFLIKPEMANRLDRLFASYEDLSPDERDEAHWMNRVIAWLRRHISQ
jgi:cell volume regulation protein A